MSTSLEKISYGKDFYVKIYFTLDVETDLALLLDSTPYTGRRS